MARRVSGVSGRTRAKAGAEGINRCQFFAPEGDLDNGMVAPLSETASRCRSGDAMFHQPREATTMKITTAGIDPAKNVFQIHGIDERGKTR
jgi:hypothetical protein